MEEIPKQIKFTEEEVNTMYSVLSPLYKWDTKPPSRGQLIKSVALVFEKFYGEVKVMYTDGYINGRETKVYLGEGKTINVHDIIGKMVDDKILSTSKVQAYDIDGNELFADPYKKHPQTYTVYKLNKMV